MAFASGPTSPAEARRCGEVYVHAVVGGRHVCLRSGHGCTSRFDRKYHRYRFHCHGGVLTAFVWAPLRRPLRLPTVPAGSPCPKTTAAQVHPAWGAALGAGPVYPLLGTPPGPATLELRRLRRFHDGYHVKTIWLVDPVRFSGRFLVRGRRVDAPGLLRFWNAPADPAPPAVEGRLTVFVGRGETEWREAYGSSTTIVPDAGCYGVQIDAARFSRAVVFEAR